MYENMLEDLLNAGRIQHHGEVLDLTSEFSFTNDTTGNARPCSIMVVPKSGTTDDGVIIDNVKLAQDSLGSAFPIPAWHWSEGVFLSLPANSIDLTKWRVFYGGMGNL